MALKETMTEFVISFLRAVIVFALFDGCFGRLIKLILIQTVMEW